MNVKNSTNSYGSLSIGIHWLMLLAAVYALMIGMPLLGWLALGAAGSLQYTACSIFR